MVIRGVNAGASDVLIIDAQRLLQQAHCAGRRLAGAHLGPLLGSDLHRPFQRALVARYFRRVVKPQNELVGASLPWKVTNTAAMRLKARTMVA